MARVMMVGVDPDLVDFSDPALPPGMDAETIRRGIALGLAALAAAGHEARHLYVPADPDDLGALAGALARERIDCVVIGGGVRLLPSNLFLFEAVLNLIARATPTPAIALISRPEESPAAAARALDRSGG